jgi:hypothetical protein
MPMSARERAEAGPKVCVCSPLPIPQVDDLGLRCAKCGGDLTRRYSPRVQHLIRRHLRRGTLTN